jgi:hypothetical protein
VQGKGFEHEFTSKKSGFASFEQFFWFYYEYLYIAILFEISVIDGRKKDEKRKENPGYF